MPAGGGLDVGHGLFKGEGPQAQQQRAGIDLVKGLVAAQHDTALEVTNPAEPAGMATIRPDDWRGRERGSRSRSTASPACTP